MKSIKNLIKITTLSATVLVYFEGFRVSAASPINHQVIQTAKKFELVSHTFTSKRGSTHYWESGPVNGPLMIFVHGWPEIGLTWRAQMETLASQGWHCIAPDLRGFGSSSVPANKTAYALQEVVNDLLALHVYLGGKPAVWVGHDWGSPVVGLIASHYPKICRGIVLVSVPYMPNGWALPNLIPYIDRKLYPLGKYPDGQWDYWRFYLTHFNQAVSDMDADIPATLASIFTKGQPSSFKKLSPSALVTAKGGRFGAKHRAPAMKPDLSLWPQQDWDRLVAVFKKSGFRPADSYYLNDDANIAYAKTSINNGRLTLPVLYINDKYEPFSNIYISKIGDPMRKSCSDLTVVELPSGHWVTLECKSKLSTAITSWIKYKGLK